MKNWKFHRLLHSRFDEKTGARMTTTLLAERAGVRKVSSIPGASTTPPAGASTLDGDSFPWLTYEEIRALGWEREFEL